MTPTYDPNQIIDQLSSQLDVKTRDFQALCLELHERGLLCASCGKLGIHFVTPMLCDSCAMREGEP